MNENQRREKVEERKQQVIAENIIQSYCKLNDEQPKPFYETLVSSLGDSYPSLYKAFEDVIENGTDLSKHGVDKTTFESLLPFIKERIKQKEVSIEARLEIHSYDKDGVTKINDINKKIIDVDKNVDLQFLGSGSFKLIIKAREYETAETHYSAVESILEKNTDGNNTSYSLQRE